MTYLLVFLPFVFFSQQTEKKQGTRATWEKMREENGYKPSEKYKGPEQDNYFSPSTIKENQSTSGSQNGTTTPYQGVPYSPGKQKQGKNGGNGNIQDDPNIEPAEPVDVPDYDSQSNSSGPDVNLPSGSTEFWKWLFIILLTLAVAYIIFHLIKNRTPREKNVTFEPILEEMNPAEIQKSELKIRLDAARNEENYKECVRIYFLFAMKDLIERKWIFWKKDKTNMHYIIEMQGRHSTRDFEKIVSIYDLVWYGDYEVDATAYREFEPVLIRAYQQIQQDR